jgi:hypothetical protein
MKTFTFKSYCTGYWPRHYTVKARSKRHALSLIADGDCEIEDDLLDAECTDEMQIELVKST